MNKKELQKNYRAEYYFDEKGEEKVKYVYVGGTYELSAPKNILLFKVLYCVFVGLCIPAYILPLCFECGAFRQIYFTMPYVFQVFPILYLIWAAYRAVRVSAPYKERAKNTIFIYSKVSCIVGEVLSVAALVSCAVYIVKEGPKGMDYLAIAFTVACAVLFFAVYINLSRAKLNRIDTEKPEQNPEQNPDVIE